MARLRVESIYGSARRQLLSEIVKYNTAAVGRRDYKPLAITAEERGKVIGGLVGETYLDWLAIEILWIDDEHRRTGLGRQLVEKAESEARKRGAQNVYLNTFSFQAPGFYAKLGYTEFGRLNDFPQGHSRHWMMKTL
jgi:GNAT superfamily N-acetyltransferase